MTGEEAVAKVKACYPDAHVVAWANAWDDGYVVRAVKDVRTNSGDVIRVEQDIGIGIDKADTWINAANQEGL
jgi:hypothetical protein